MSITGHGRYLSCRCENMRWIYMSCDGITCHAMDVDSSELDQLMGNEDVAMLGGGVVSRIQRWRS
jgi:hypothetical protein